MTQLPWTIHDYSLDIWPFPTYLEDALGIADLTSLHDDGPLWKEREDQNSEWHRRLYAGFPRWQHIYEDFIYTVASRWVTEPFYYQRIPTFRVHLPNNVAVGAVHTDAKYHHPAGETTFWIPCTPTTETSTVWIGDDDGAMQPAVATPGEIVEFSAVSRLHGNVVNTSGKSRVSFDFRCLPEGMLPDVEGPPSENMKMRFVPGAYYARELVRPR